MSEKRCDLFKATQTPLLGSTPKLPLSVTVAECISALQEPTEQHRGKLLLPIKVSAQGRHLILVEVTALPLEWCFWIQN